MIAAPSVSAVLESQHPVCINWGQHMTDAAQAGVIAILFGAGVGASTTSLGSPRRSAY